MAVLFHADAENGLTTPFTVTGTVTAQSTTKNNGTYAYQFEGGAAQAHQLSTGAVVADNTFYRVDNYRQFSSTPLSVGNVIVWRFSKGAGNIATLALLSSGKLRINLIDDLGANNTKTGDTVVTGLVGFQKITMKFTKSTGNNGTAQVYLNDVLECEIGTDRLVDNDTLWNTGTAATMLWNNGSDTTGVFTYVDDIWVQNTDTDPYLLFSDDWETQDNTAWTSVTGTVTVQNTKSAAGYAAQMGPGGNFANSLKKTGIPDSNFYRIDFKVAADAWGTAAQRTFFDIIDTTLGATNGIIGSLVQTTTPRLRVTVFDDAHVGTNDSGNVSPVDLLGTAFHIITVKFFKSSVDGATDGRAELYVDGVEYATTAGVDSFTQWGTGTKEVRIGNAISATNNTYYDEFYVQTLDRDPFTSSGILTPSVQLDSIFWLNLVTDVDVRPMTMFGVGSFDFFVEDDE